MSKLKEQDLPHGLYQLLIFWQGEEIDPEIRRKICDGEISEEEEVQMFLKWCQKQDDLDEQDKKDLQELLKKS